jgi:polyisoprenoid-binding protein YceI
MGTVWILVAACTLASSTSWAQSETYRVVAAESRLDIHVGRAGLFKVLGHDHIIRAGSFTGTVEWDSAEPEAARFVLEVDAASLSVIDEDTGLSDDDRATVQDRMETDVLALAEHSTIAFTSTRVRIKRSDSDEHGLEVSGDLALRGVRRELDIPLTLSFDAERNTVIARGKIELDSEAWGVPQIAALGGSVKTDTKLGLEFEIVALRE